jgi:hypothetical protein
MRAIDRIGQLLHDINEKLEVNNQMLAKSMISNHMRKDSSTERNN